MRADGVLFDKDGTLFSFSATWSLWARGFLDQVTGGDRTRAHEIGRAIGFDYDSATFAPDSVVVAHTAGQVAEALLPYIDMDLGALELFLTTESAKVPQVPAVPLLPLLMGFRARGLRLGLATNDAEAPARAHLQAAEISGCFDFIAGYDSGFGSKPGPGMCLGFSKTMGLDPARLVMVGDSLHDLHAGRAAGMQVVAVLTGLAGEADLAPYADAVLPDIGHLPAWLEG